MAREKYDMIDFTGKEICVNEKERDMIDYCNNSNDEWCINCPYNKMCLDFELKYDVIPYGFVENF